MMPDTPSSILVAEIGSLTTRVTLVDEVDGERRLIGRAEVFSSIEPPHQHALVAVLEGAVQIAEATGRQLLHEGQLLMPQNRERDGIDQVVFVSSAAGNLALVITAIASDVSARSALHASRCTYTSLLQIITLDDAMMRTSGDGSDSWIVRQIQSMLAQRPDLVLMAGGLEDGASEALGRLAHIVGLTNLRTAVDTSGQQRQDVAPRPVIFAGNSAASGHVAEVLADRAEILIVDNVRPTLEVERLEPARQEIVRLYDERILDRLPGLPTLRRLSSKSAPITTVCNVEGLITRFVAEQYKRQVLTLDVGATSSSAFLAGPGHYHPVVLGNCGTSYGLTTLLKEQGVANIARWLPFPISEEELTQWLLNKLLRPHLIPASREDVYIEQAVTREALMLVLDALHDECPAPGYDLVLASGGVLSHVPHPGMAALMLLDVLPAVEQNILALDLHLDALGLLPACGALARFDPDAAVTVFESDLWHNTPLATCVVLAGEGASDTVAVEAELVGRGQAQRVSVRHGQIARLRLDPGSRGQLILRPAPGVHIGHNEPGAEVRSDLGALKGSALGIIIDARGRPLRLPVDEVHRCAQIWEWLVALGAEYDRSPYVNMPLSTPEVIDVDHVADAPVADTEPGRSTQTSKAVRRWGRRARTPDTDATSPEPSIATQPASVEPAVPSERVTVSGTPLVPDTATLQSELVGAVEPVPVVEPPAVPAVKPGSRISLSDVAAQGGEPPAAARAPVVKPGSRISLSDVAAQGGEPPAAGRAPAVKPGSRISLSDLAAQGGEPPAAAQAPAVKPGSRISLSDLAAQELAQSSKSVSSSGSDEHEPDTIQSDLAKLRQSVSEPKRGGWFGRKK